MELSLTNVDSFLRSVDLSRHSSEIDLRYVTFFDTYAIIYIGMFIRYHRAEGVSFSVLPPNTAAARSYLARLQFWERFHFTDESVTQEQRWSSASTTSFNDIINIDRSNTIAEEVSDAFHEVLAAQRVGVRVSALTEVVVELVANFAEHSQTQLPAACTMQWFPKMKKVAFAIGDCGIGIRESLASSQAQAQVASLSHEAAAVKAIEPLVTRKREGGMGLTLVKDAVLKYGGSVVLTTGDGWVTVSEQGQRSGQQKMDLPGVRIMVTFPEV